MKPKLFVGNLSFETTDEELRKLFEPYGPVESANVIVDKRSGRSKGYGFVLMAEGKDAAMALELSGREFKGRDIVVTEAESPIAGEGGDRDRGRGRHRRDREPRRREARGMGGVGIYPKPERPEDRFFIIPKKKKTLFQKLFGWLIPKKKEAPAPAQPGRGDRPDRHERHDRPNRSFNRDHHRDGGRGPRRRRRRFRHPGRRDGGGPSQGGGQPQGQPSPSQPSA